MAVLRDKAIVITGSTRGLGRAYALAAAREGARVLVNGRSEDTVEALVTTIRSEGGVAEGYACELGGWEAATHIVERCVERFGRLDGFVNNAAITSRRPEPWLHTEEEVRSTLEVNVFGTMFCGMAALRQMVSQGGGSLVNVVSTAALGLPGNAVYGATKGAVASWTYCLALDLAGTGVRVNALSPTAQTDMVPRTPGREGPPPDTAAPMAIYLLSDLSQEIHGQTLRIVGSRIATLAAPQFRDALEHENWTAETIADAMRTTLKHQLKPVGLDMARHPEFAPR